MKLDKLRQIVQEECRLDFNRPVLVGVSGGPDSLCLFVGLAQLGFPLVVAHFDHRLRPTSQADADVVRLEAERLDFPFCLGSQDVAAFAQNERLSIEEAARTLRYRFLFAAAREYGAQAVAVGHTADDQVETVLMHLLRGSGLPGLAGMSFRSQMEAWDAGICLVRPLLAFWRSETVAYCQEHGLPAVTDASNQDLAFFRNRLRNELLPFLETYNPRIRQVLWRMARVMAGEEAVVRAAVSQAWQDCHAKEGPGEVRLDLAVFQAMDIGLQRGLLRRAVAHLLPDLHDVDFAAIERALHFLAMGSMGQVELLRGLRLFSEGSCLVVISPNALPSPTSWPQLETKATLSLDLPGQVALPGGWCLVGERVDRVALPDFQVQEDLQNWEAWLDEESLPGGMTVRPPRPGDRFQPLGMAGHLVKLSDFWINQKHPRRARAGWPLVAAGDMIIWVPGFRLAHPYRVTENTRKVLHLSLFRVSARDDTPK